MEERVNWKGRLQEKLSKENKITTKVEYVTHKMGPDHAPIFQSFVKVNGFHSSALGNSRKKSEQLAAKLLLLQLEHQNKSQSVDVTKTNVLKLLGVDKVLFAFDLENVTSQLNDFFQSFDFEGVDLKGYFSTFHHNANKDLRFEDLYGNFIEMEIHKIDSSRRDACDVGMIMSVTNECLKNQPEMVYIVTRDKFGAALTDCINSNFLDIQTKAFHIPDAQTLKNHVLNFEK